MILNKIDTAAKTNETKTTCEFITRESKGDQLYNQHQALLNGIANIPFGEDLFAQHHIAGILSFFLGGLEPMEYSKFPYKTASVYNGLRNVYEETVGTSEFDTKSRLIKLRGFFRDADLIPYEWKITYYK